MIFAFFFNIFHMLSAMTFSVSESARCGILYCLVNDLTFSIILSPVSILIDTILGGSSSLNAGTFNLSLQAFVAIDRKPGIPAFLC